MTPQQRGGRANELLNNDLLKESLAVMAAAYTGALRQCHARDDLGRYRFAVALDVIDGVKRHLESVLADGLLSAKQAEELNPRSHFEKITRIF